MCLHTHVFCLCGRVVVVVGWGQNPHSASVFDRVRMVDVCDACRGQVGASTS